MESQDLRNAVDSLVSLLRKITRIVQLVPFVYLLFYMMYMLFGCMIGEETLFYIDNILYVHPTAFIGLLFASRLLKLCIWHKAACVLPMSSRVESYIDCNIFQFTQNEILIINLTIGIVALLFLIAAHRHFFYGRKRTNKSYA